jgi:hypothetical protein
MNSEPLSQKNLTQIRTRSEEATPAPWIDFIERRDHLSGESFIGRGVSRSEEALYLVGGTDADIIFVAHARQDIPLLLDEIERLHKEIERLHDEIKMLKNTAKF